MNRQILLEARSRILRDISELGEMHSGTISTRYQQCSTKNCICKSKEHPGHGPIYALTYYNEIGKLVSRNYKPGKQLDLIKAQVENYHSYKELSKQFIQINNKLSDLREQDSQNPVDVKKNSSKKSGSLSKKK